MCSWANFYRRLANEARERAARASNVSIEDKFEAVAAMANVNPSSVGTVEAIDAASTAAKPAPLILAQRRIWVRRSKCTEGLGYGRTGSYGCG